MNLEMVRQVGRDNPSWLPANLGRTCYAHTTELMRRIRAAGGEAFYVCKMAGEGGYTPPGFTPRTVTGLDGKPYTIARVSHDVIFFRPSPGAPMMQFDTLASANEHDQPIYHRNGDPNWSFDPSDGPQIVASAVWNDVPSSLWRPWNPPLVEGGTPIPSPTPIPSQPRTVAFPPRNETAAFFSELNRFYGVHGRRNRVVLSDSEPDPLFVDNEGLAVWLPEYLRRRVNGEDHTGAIRNVLDDVARAMGV